MNSTNQLDGRPLTFGDERQIRMVAMTTPNPLYDPRPNSPDIVIDCIRCSQPLRIRKRYNAVEEKMQYVTPRVHSCRCGARILLYRYNPEFPVYNRYGGELFRNGEVIFRHLGAYEPIDEMDHCHQHDSWKFYRIYPFRFHQIKTPILSDFPGKTP